MKPYWQKEIKAAISKLPTNPNKRAAMLLDALLDLLDACDHDGSDCNCYNYGGRAVIVALGGKDPWEK